MQILEAFRALNALNEDTFDLDADGINKLSDFKNNDDLEDDISIIDPEAETKDDLQDNYIGKVILDCCVCHSKLYKDKSEVNIDDSGELANVGDECPYCFTPDGFKVIGEVAEFGGEEDSDDDEPIEELFDANVSLDARGFGGKDNNVSILGGKSPLGESLNADTPEEELDEGIFDFGAKKRKKDLERRRAETDARIDREWDEKAKKEKARREQEDREKDARSKATQRRLDAHDAARRNSSSSRTSSSNTGYAGISYSGGDYFSEGLDEGIFSSKVVLMYNDFGDWKPIATGVHTAKLGQYRDAYMNRYGGEKSDFKSVSVGEAKKMCKNFKVHAKSIPDVEKNMPKWAAEFDKQAVEAEKERKRGADRAREWGEWEERQRKNKRDYERSRYNSIKGDTPSNTGYKGINYSGGDYYSESLDEGIFDFAKKKKNSSRNSNKPSSTIDWGEEGNTYRAKPPVYMIYYGPRGFDHMEVTGDEGLLKAVRNLGQDIKKILDTNGEPVDVKATIKAAYADQWKGSDCNEGIFDFAKKKKKPAKDKSDMISAPLAFRQGAAFDWDAKIDSKDSEGQSNLDIRGNVPRNPAYFDESLTESVNNVNVETDDSVVTVSTDESGKVTVSTEPVTANGGETIEPVSPETEAELTGMDDAQYEETEEVAESEGEEVPEGEEEVEVPIDEVDEGSFDESLNSYFRRAYGNVNSYRTTAVKSSGNTLMVEGRVRMNNNKVHKTSFILEAKDITKDGRVRFVGGNKQLTENKKAFTVTGRVRNNRLITESLSYNYRTKGSNGKMSRVYGVERTSNRRK